MPLGGNPCFHVGDRSLYIVIGDGIQKLAAISPVTRCLSGSLIGSQIGLSLERSSCRPPGVRVGPEGSSERRPRELDLISHLGSNVCRFLYTREGALGLEKGKVAGSSTGSKGGILPLHCPILWIK